MSKVFVVTQGCYSDYHICRAFSSKDLAEQWIGDRKEKDEYYDDMGIEEYELDDFSGSERNKILSYRIEMNLSGEITHCKPDFGDDARVYVRGPGIFGRGPYIDFKIPTTDEVAARKTASEIRARMIALSPDGAAPGEYDYHTAQIKRKW